MKASVPEAAQTNRSHQTAQWIRNRTPGLLLDRVDPILRCYSLDGVENAGVVRLAVVHSTASFSQVVQRRVRNYGDSLRRSESSSTRGPTMASMARASCTSTHRGAAKPRSYACSPRSCFGRARRTPSSSRLTSGEAWAASKVARYQLIIQLGRGCTLPLRR